MNDSNYTRSHGRTRGRYPLSVLRRGFVRQRRAGMTLIECLVYVAIFCVVVNLCVSVFLGMSRLSAMQTTALDRMREVEEVREVFSRAVRASYGVVAGVGAYKTGPDQLVLEMPSDPAAAKANHYTILGKLGKESRLARLELVANDGKYTSDSYVTYALPIDALRFQYDPGQPRVVQCEVDVPNAAKKKNKPPVTYHFLASLRGKSESSGDKGLQPHAYGERPLP